mmetsp:Transcript_48613/g.137431  ORF Transcript_48613/g.137431 Transcript_48613/m.137431 type:complete len:240 (+) Transcript_48613:680-1399(+)
MSPSGATYFLRAPLLRPARAAPGPGAAGCPASGSGAAGAGAASVRACFLLVILFAPGLPRFLPCGSLAWAPGSGAAPAGASDVSAGFDPWLASAAPAGMPAHLPLSAAAAAARSSGLHGGDDAEHRIDAMQAVSGASPRRPGVAPLEGAVPAPPPGGSGSAASHSAGRSASTGGCPGTVAGVPGPMALASTPPWPSWGASEPMVKLAAAIISSRARIVPFTVSSSSRSWRTSSVSGRHP